MNKFLGALALSLSLLGTAYSAEPPMVGKVNTIIVDHFQQNRSSYDAHIRIGNEVYKLEIEDDPKFLEKLNNKQIKISPRKNGRTLKIKKNEVEILSQEHPLQLTGTQKVLIVNVNFIDASSGASNATLTDRVFGATNSVADLYRQSSRNGLNIVGDVVGPYTINYSASGACDYTGWGIAADAAVAAAGYNVNAYDKVTYAVPKGTCGWSGLAYLGGSRGWVNNHSVGVYAHELGHNFGMHHASTTSSEYGDASDPMGGARSVMFNSPHAVLQGWAGNSIVNNTPTGQYILYPVDTLTNIYPQHLVVPIGTTGESYYVSFRTPTNISINLPSGWNNVVQIHKGSSLSSRTYAIANLGIFGVYEDATIGFKAVVDDLVPYQTATVSITSNNVVPPPPPPPPPGDTTFPVVTWNTPFNGQVFNISKKSDKINLSVNASDNIGVVKVEFYVNGSLENTDSSEPWSYRWNVNPHDSTGSYNLTAKAYDAAGNSSSNSINIYINR